MIVAPKEKTPIKESAHKDILALTSKKKPTNFSFVVKESVYKDIMEMLVMKLSCQD